MDWSNQDPSELRRLFYGNPPDCTLGFNGPPRLSNGKVFAEEVEVPHVCWLVDSAHHFRDYVDFKLHTLITPDQTSCDLMRLWGAKSVYFLPHGADPLPLGLPFEERPYSLAFFGSIYDPEEILQKWRKDLPKSLVDFLVETADRVLAIPEACYQTELIKNELLNQETALPLIQEFDIYLRALDRKRLLQSLKGLPVHFFGLVEGGKTLQDIVGPVDSFIQHSHLEFEETLQMMGKCKLILNSSPMFKTGGHERIFYAQSAGSAVLTNDTPWIRSHYAVGDEILCYGGLGLDKLAGFLTDQEKKLASIAEKGREKALKEHTWDVRAGQLLEILQKELPLHSNY